MGKQLSHYTGQSAHKLITDDPDVRREISKLINTQLGLGINQLIYTPPGSGKPPTLPSLPPGTVLGTVTSVNSIVPDENGNVFLTPGDIGAVAIPDLPPPTSVSRVQYNLSLNPTPTIIAQSNTFYKVVGITGRVVAEGFEHGENSATYIDPRSPAQCVCFFSGALTSGNNNMVSLRIAVNGVTITASNLNITTSGSNYESFSSQTYLTLNTGDTVELWVANDTKKDVTVKNMNIMVNTMLVTYSIIK